MILLDTCTLLWLAGDPPHLPQTVVTAIRSVPPGQRFVSAISAFEIGVKHARGRLTLPMVPRLWFDETCAQRGLTPLAITKDIALRATELAPHHQDPADRLIIATALQHGLTVLTPDIAFQAYTHLRTAW